MTLSDATVARLRDITELPDAGERYTILRLLGRGGTGAVYEAEDAVLGRRVALKVVATDPGSMRDFQAFARQTGNELVDQQTVGDEFIHLLRRR